MKLGNMIKKNASIFLFIFVFTAVMIMGLNYYIGNDYVDVPYAMNRNYAFFQRDDGIDVKSLDFLYTHDNVKAVAETDDDNVIGLYDPEMNYYVKSTKIICDGVYRYFSTEDYLNGSDVGVLIYSVDLMREFGFKVADTKDIEEKYGVEVINVFDPSSDIADSKNVDVLLVKNLFAIKPSDIRAVYIDSSDSKQLRSVSEEAEKAGFKRIRDDKSVFRTLYEAFNAKLYVKFFVVSCVVFF